VLLGNVVDEVAEAKLWMEPVSENPTVGATEVWEFHNTTGDAHPTHLHEVVFELVNREGLEVDGDGEVVEPIQLDGNITPPEPWESAFKDTVIAYPGHAGEGALQHARPVRLALPHRRARGQRDDAALPHRAAAARPAD
jgi:spore coat protein A, manganese oxidase